MARERQGTEGTIVIRARREAGPQPYDKLTFDQQAAFRGIAELIDDALERLSSRRVSEEELTFRHSQVAVLHGERGTGKTTAYLSLRQPGGMPPDLADRVTRLRNHVVWLDHLDLDPLPEPTNLLAAILARVERAIDGPYDDGSPSSSWSEEFRAAVQDLHALEADVALAWDGTQRERPVGLDPDQHASEVMRAEAVRLQLNDRMNRVLSALSLLPARHRRKPPALFVLPIDDFDLNVRHAPALLRLLRTISVPQLFYLLLADYDVMKDVLVWEKVGDLAGLLKFGELAEAPVNVERIHSRARELAYAALRKVLPPGQVFRLKGVTPGQALRLTSPDGLPDLTSVLRTCSLDLDRSFRGPIIPPPTNLLDFLEMERLGTGPASQDGTLRRPSFEASIFEGPLRPVIDLWTQVAEVSTTPPDATRSRVDKDQVENARMLGLVDVVIEETRKALHEQHWVDARTCEELLATMHQEADGRWRLEADRGWVIAAFTSAPQVTMAGGRTSDLSAKELTEVRIGGEPPHPTSRSSSQGAQTIRDHQYLPRRAGALFALLHDLFVRGRHVGTISGGELPERIRWEAALVSCKPALLTLRRRDIELTWPLPRLRTIRQHDQLGTAWHEALEWIGRRSLARKRLEPAERYDMGVTSLAEAWLGIGTQLVRGDDPLAVLSSSDAESPIEIGMLRSGLGDLRSFVVDSVGRLRPADFMVAAFWLVESVGMLAPELGMTPVPARRLLDVAFAQGDSFWSRPENIAHVRRFRTAMLYPLVRAGEFELAARFGMRGIPGTRVVEGTFERNPPPEVLKDAEEEARSHPINTLADGGMRPTHEDMERVADAEVRGKP